MKLKMPTWGNSSGNFRIELGLPEPALAMLLLVLLCGLLGFGLWNTLGPQPPKPKPAVVAVTHPAPGAKIAPKKREPNDADLYKWIIDDVHQGIPYYQSASDRQRHGHYPLRPFLAVRPPLMAVTLGALPGEFARRALLAGLAAVTVAAWAWRLVEMKPGKVRLAAMMGLFLCGITAAFSVAAWPFHETWAGLLIALSLAHRRPKMWFFSVVIGLIAALWRELAVAYLLAMAVMALKDGYRREALAWVAAIGIFAVSLYFHAQNVQAHVLASDPTSQGWFKISGWPFVLKAVGWNSVLVGTPRWLAAVLLPFSLIGLAMWRNPFGERVALTAIGYVAAFVFFGRPENAYWGLMIAPLLPIGLLFAPQAVLALGRQAVGWRAPRTTNAPSASAA